MDTKKTSNQILVVAIIILIGFLIIQNRRISTLQNWTRDLKIGEKAPMFSGLDLLGNEINMPQKGHSCVIVFFNTICNSCKKSIPYINAVYDSLIIEKVELIGVCASNSLSTANYIKIFAVKFPTIPDEKRRISKKYRVRYVPMMVLVDTNQHIKYIQSYGENVKQTLKVIFNKLKNKNERETR